jgi:hypothetical protein
MILFALKLGRLLFQVIGVYTVALVSLDGVWWWRRRNWRHLQAGLLALLMMALLQQGDWYWF